jgi:hypothetical protein
MTEVIERVARAICRGEGWDEEDIWPDCIESARLAIEALLEPTDEMVQAGYVRGLDENGLNLTEAWRAMIERAGARERDGNVITFGKRRTEK